MTDQERLPAEDEVEVAGSSDRVGLSEAADELTTTFETFVGEASRASDLAFTLRAAIDQARDALGALDAQRDERQRAIDAELANAESQIEAVRGRVADEQARLDDLLRAQAEATEALERTAGLKERVLGQLESVQEQLRSTMPAMAELQDAQRTLETALASVTEAAADSDDDTGDPTGDEVRSSRPLGRMMDVNEQGWSGKREGDELAE